MLDKARALPAAGIAAGQNDRGIWGCGFAHAQEFDFFFGQVFGQVACERRRISGGQHTSAFAGYWTGGQEFKW